MGARGTQTIDFGGSFVSEASVPVTGQGTILGTSACEAWVMEATTVDNDALAHKTLATLGQCYCESVVAGTGFTIRVLIPEAQATGTFKLQWVWN